MTHQKIKSFDPIPSPPRHELLQVADIVAREKGIERDDVIDAMEQAIQKAAKARYGGEHDIHAKISPSTGSITLSKHIMIVEDDQIENTVTQMPYSEAIKDPDLAGYGVGDVIEYPLPPIDCGRIAVHSARQVIHQKVRDAERSKLYDEYAERVGQIISAVVKRIEFGNVILDLGHGEAILRRDEIIPREAFKPGDRIRTLIIEVNPGARGPMIITSRTHPGFMAKLFEQEVPEIYDGVIEIKAIARDPGSRAKMAVFAADSSLDPVGSCVGMRGSRVQAVVSELQGEKVDIIPWSANMATFIVNALAPAEASKVVIDEDNQRVDVVVPEDQLSLAIGRRGQNVRLASQLTNWRVDILTEAQEIERRTNEQEARTQLFIDALDVDDMIAHLLVAEGFVSVQEIVDIDLDEFGSIDGFDEDIAQELQNRARSYISSEDGRLRQDAQNLGASSDLLALNGLDARALLTLVKKNIKTLDDFADLSGDELLDILGKDHMTLENANDLIMKAREHWFEDNKK